MLLTFLQQIGRDPADDPLYGVLADWLGERGDVREQKVRERPAPDVLRVDAVQWLWRERARDLLRRMPPLARAAHPGAHNPLFTGAAAAFHRESWLRETERLRPRAEQDWQTHGAPGRGGPVGQAAAVARSWHVLRLFAAEAPGLQPEPYLPGSVRLHFSQQPEFRKTGMPPWYLGLWVEEVGLRARCPCGQAGVPLGVRHVLVGQLPTQTLDSYGPFWLGQCPRCTSVLWSVSRATSWPPADNPAP